MMQSGNHAAKALPGHRYYRKEAMAFIAAMAAMPIAVLGQDLAAVPELPTSELTAPGTSAISMQYGVSNNSRIDQQGGSEVALVTQFGQGNDASIMQMGSHNFATATQYGAYNQADIDQSGYNNTAVGYQAGYANELSITQTANHGYANVSQLGRANSVTVVQTGQGSAAMPIYQLGRGLKMTVYQ